MMDGGNNPGTCPEYPGKCRGKHSQLKRIGKCGKDKGEHRLIHKIALSQVSPERITEIAEKLRQNRLVKLHGLGKPFDRCFAYMLIEQHGSGITGNDPEYNENQKHYSQEHKNGSQASPYQSCHIIST